MVDFQAPNLNFFSASFEFKVVTAAYKHNQKMTIDFTAFDEANAVEDAHRFWVQRQKDAPRYFSEAVHVSVCRKSIGPIKPDGRLTAASGFPFFEWKKDHPEKLEGAVNTFVHQKANRNKGFTGTVG